MAYEKEYCIYCKYNGGTPFILRTFKTFEAARIKLMEMIEIEEERNRPYFVENNFFINKYVGNIPGKHFAIKERNISGWSLYDASKNIKKNNIVYLNECINKLKMN